MKRFILQAVTEENHLTAVKQIISIPNIQQVKISTAFMNEAGLAILEDELKTASHVTTLFVGIRNGITSAQGLEKALEIGCHLIAVDTGSRTRIFHPKVYFAKNEDEAHLITGSANLTIGGLNSNIEASIWHTLNLDDAENIALIDDFTSKLDAMSAEFPEHVFEITDSAKINELLEAGRVADESIAPPPEPAGTSRNRDLDTTPRMKLKTKAIRRPRPTKVGTPTAAPAAAPATPPSTLPKDRYDLVWESSPLTRRDLTIPTGGSTHQTGSMLFKKGNSDIDQQTYFRATVFDQLDWSPDPRTAGKELARANFRLVIRDIDYGVHNLTVTNDTRTDTRMYEQRQPMSAIRWGAARSLISREDLLDRTLLLYRDTTTEGSFLMEID